MTVTVTLQGALGGLGADRRPGPIDLALPDGATAGDLLRPLAERFGGALREALDAGGEKLPPSVRMFVNGELTVRRDQPLATPDASSQEVLVVLMAPISGGAL
jgi:hypothetical protein